METRQQLKLEGENDINVCIIRPPGYMHSEAFRDAAERIEAEAQRGGRRCKIRDNKIEAGWKNIVFGAHLNTEASKEYNSEDILLINLERLDKVEEKGGEDYLKLLDDFEYIDFCSGNIKSADRIGIKKPIYIYRPWFEKRWQKVIQPWEKTWDVGFIGSITPRREDLLERLTQQGLKIKAVFGAYAAERDSIIGRCKVMLNAHAYDSENDVELWRLNYYATNGLRIISEESNFEEGEEEISRRIEQCKLEDIDELIKSAVKDDSNRESKRKGMHLQESCIDIEKRFKQRDTKGRNRKPATRDTGSNKHPLILSIGFNQKIDPEALNIHIRPKGEEDLILDISENWENICKKQYSKRHGEIHIGEAYFDYIEAIDILGHIGNLKQGLQNIVKLLKPGGWFYTIFPHQMSAGAWADPGSIRGMNEKIFTYLNELSEEINLGDSRLKLKWIKYASEDVYTLKDCGYKDRLSVEALLTKEITDGRTVSESFKPKGKIENLGIASIKEKLCRKTYFMESEEKSNTKKENRSNQSERLDKGSARRKERPHVSIITPTMGSRFKYLALSWQWILAQDYPHEKMEWLIMTDTNEEAEYLKNDLKNVKNSTIDVVIRSCSKKMRIGEKRNRCHEFVNGEIIVNMDDDDYYFSERVSHAVDKLTAAPDMELAGSQYLPTYFLDDQSLWISDPGPKVACAGSFAYKKSLLQKTWFPSYATNGEEVGFTDWFSTNLVALDPFKTMVCIAHKSNTFDKDRLRKLVNGKNLITKDQNVSVAGEKYFFRVDSKSSIQEQSMWQQVYGQLEIENKTKQERGEGHDASVFNALESNTWDTFAENILGHWLRSNH